MPLSDSLEQKPALDMYIAYAAQESMSLLWVGVHLTIVFINKRIKLMIIFVIKVLFILQNAQNESDFQYYCKE